MPKRQCYCLLYIVCIWGITEVIISTLQKVNYLESNHHDFGITGTFGNPGPLGGLLAVCWIVSSRPLECAFTPNNQHINI